MPAPEALWATSPAAQPDSVPTEGRRSPPLRGRGQLARGRPRGQPATESWSARPRRAPLPGGPATWSARSAAWPPQRSVFPARTAAAGGAAARRRAGQGPPTVAALPQWAAAVPTVAAVRTVAAVPTVAVRPEGHAVTPRHSALARLGVWERHGLVAAAREADAAAPCRSTSVWCGDAPPPPACRGADRCPGRRSQVVCSSLFSFPFRSMVRCRSSRWETKCPRAIGQ
jgi:hypothetical protein